MSSPTPQGSALDQRQLKEYTNIINDIRQKYEASKKLEYVKITGLKSELAASAPEGYYYTNEQLEQAKRNAEEYNAKLREYKSEVQKAYLEAQQSSRDIQSYERLSKQYIQLQQETAPQRREYLEYIKAQMSAGPVQPTGTALKRQEAGIPQQGIPGPGLGPASGSIGETLEQGIKKGLKYTEAPFKAITDPLRDTARILQELSIAELSTKAPYEPPETYGTKPVLPESTSLMVEKKPSPAAGLGAYIGSVGLDVAAASVDVATFEVRPGLQAETLTGLVGLGVEQVTGQDLGYGASLREAATGDPFRFVSTIVGSSLLAPELQALVPKTVSKVRQAYARRMWNSLGVDESALSPFEREILLDYPEEVIISEPRQQLFTRKTVKINGEEVPYFLESTPEVEKLIRETIEQSEPWSAKQVTKTPESYYALPFDEQGNAILVRGKSGMKPIKFTEPKIEEIVPKTTGPQSLTTINKAIAKTIKSGAFPQQQSWITGTVEETISYIPAMNLKNILNITPKVNIPNLFPEAAAISLGLGLTQTQRQGLKQTQQSLLKQPQAPDLSMKALQKLMNQTIQQPRSIESQIPVSIDIQTPKPIQVEIQIPRITPIQETIQEPIPPVPPIVPFLELPTSPRTPKTTIKQTPTSKKRKKKQSKRKTAKERRVDPLKLTFPNVKLNIKVPKL